VLDPDQYPLETTVECLIQHFSRRPATATGPAGGARRAGSKIS
jgi:hypothetical protein